MRERKFYPNTEEISSNGEEIRTHPNPGVSPAAKQGVKIFLNHLNSKHVATYGAFLLVSEGG